MLLKNGDKADARSFQQCVVNVEPSWRFIGSLDVRLNDAETNTAVGTNGAPLPKSSADGRSADLINHAEVGISRETAACPREPCPGPFETSLTTSNDRFDEILTVGSSDVVENIAMLG